MRERDETTQEQHPEQDRQSGSPAAKRAVAREQSEGPTKQHGDALLDRVGSRQGADPDGRTDGERG